MNIYDRLETAINIILTNPPNGEVGKIGPTLDGILKKSPRVKLVDLDALWQGYIDADIDDAEALIIQNSLPFTSFTIAHANEVIFYCQGDPVNNLDNALYTVIILDIMNGGKMGFTGPITVVNNGDDRLTNLKIAFTPPDDSNYDWDTVTSKTLLIAKQRLAILSLNRNYFYNVKIPLKVQRKRVKKGRYPNYEYKVLILDKGAKILVPPEQRQHFLKKTPPRTHLRRGHVRRYKSGKFVWVHSCIVNSRVEHTLGRISKDYEVTDQLKKVIT